MAAAASVAAVFAAFFASSEAVTACADAFLAASVSDFARRPASRA
ncbi:hypothetical protein O1L68_06150 [Streptomyces lydicus]|nr:hypothetical protein [Streptomyces lydicus]